LKLFIPSERAAVASSASAVSSIKVTDRVARLRMQAIGCRQVNRISPTQTFIPGKYFGLVKHSFVNFDLQQLPPVGFKRVAQVGF
jgi:hypothetical protein